VAFYTDNPAQDAAVCKIGHILCITSGMRHSFLDGSNGYRIEDPTTVFVRSNFEAEKKFEHSTTTFLFCLGFALFYDATTGLEPPFTR
jgi:hypothetical protein